MPHDNRHTLVTELAESGAGGGARADRSTTRSWQFRLRRKLPISQEW